MKPELERLVQRHAPTVSPGQPLLTPGQADHRAERQQSDTSGLFIKKTEACSFKVENRSLENSILILNRTRRCLSASSCSDRNGQSLLDKALAKQITARQVELDSNLHPRCKSVIVRTSTPDPEATECEDSCLENPAFSPGIASVPSPTTPSQIPEDFSIPLYNFLGSLNVTTPHTPSPHLSLAVHQPEGACGGGTPVITRAPLVPWSPPRLREAQISSHPTPVIRPGALLEILTESALLLEPFFEPPAPEEASSLSTMAAEQQKKDCRRKERKFNQLCEKYDPDLDNTLWPAVANFKEVWTEQINDVLEDLFDSVDEMLDEYAADFGTPEVEAWKLVISNANKKFRGIVGKFGKAVANGTSQPVQYSAPPVQSNTHAVKAAKVDIEIDDNIVSKESKLLTKEVKNFLDCEKASDEDIEVAMCKIDDWNKRLERIRDKAYAIKRNSECFDLNDPRVSSALCAVENLEHELNIAVEQLNAEDDKRFFEVQERDGKGNENQPGSEI